jgi:hypothetical protein
MEEFLNSGHAIDLILGMIVVEGFLLYFSLDRARMLKAMLTLLSGAMLLLAVRAALTDADWIWVAIFITAALPPHLLDLWFRRS